MNDEQKCAPREAVCDRIVCWHNRRCVNDDAATMRKCPQREAQPIYLVSSEGRFWQIVSEPVWVNWQADYRNVLYTAAREVQPVGPRTTLNYDGTFDTPTPERADA